MKKIIFLSLLSFMINLASASETVEIKGARYIKYSEAEMRGFVVKVNSLKPDMTVGQVISLLGRPDREQIVSVSPPQRILVYPLSVYVSLYRSSRSGEWQVSSPMLYGSPVCQREDGAPQKNAIGSEVVDYPGINCIPRKLLKS